MSLIKLKPALIIVSLLFILYYIFALIFLSGLPSYSESILINDKTAQSTTASTLEAKNISFDFSKDGRLWFKIQDKQGIIDAVSNAELSKQRGYVHIRVDEQAN